MKTKNSQYREKIAIISLSLEHFPLIQKVYKLLTATLLFIYIHRQKFITCMIVVN
jgi:hypothetical protein